MSSRLGKTIRDLGLENYEEAEQPQEGTNGNFVPVDLTPATDIVETHEMLAGANAQHEETQAITADMRTVSDAQAAFEAYAALLEKAGDEGIDETAAAFMRVGMEHFEKILGLNTPVTPALENWAGPSSNRRSTQVSLESIKDRAKGLGKMLKDLLKKLMQGLMHFLQNLVAGIGRLEERATRAEEKAKAIKGRPAKPSFELKNPAKLFADGVFKGQDVTAIAGVAEFMAIHYPREVKAYADGAAAIIKSAKEGEDISVRLGELKKPGSDAFAKPEILPGNQIITVLENTDGGTSGLTFKEAPDAKPAPDSCEVKVRDLSKISQHIDAILTTCNRLRECRKVESIFKPSMEALANALEGRDDLGRWMREMLTEFAGSSFSQFQGVVIYCAWTLNAQLAVCEQELALYQQPSA